VYRADSSNAFNPLNNVGGVTKNRGHFTFDGTGSNFGGAMPEMVNSTKDSRTIVVSCERGIQIKYASVGLIMQGS
jgi:hypothetical protein